jgi:hypothetical protein
MATHELAQFAGCLIVARLIAKGLLSDLADLSIWALRLSGPSHKEGDD